MYSHITFIPLHFLQLDVEAENLSDLIYDDATACSSTTLMVSNGREREGLRVPLLILNSLHLPVPSAGSFGSCLLGELLSLSSSSPLFFCRFDRPSVECRHFQVRGISITSVNINICCLLMFVCPLFFFHYLSHFRNVVVYRLSRPVWQVSSFFS